MKDRLRLLRPAHCLKNILVLLPLIFSGRLSDGASGGAGLRVLLPAGLRDLCSE